LIAASGAALAFVLQGALGNVAAGVMLILFRPFKIGDEVEIGGSRGKVTGIELTATTLSTTDNVKTIVANGKVWSGTIKNYTSMGARRLDRDFAALAMMPILRKPLRPLPRLRRQIPASIQSQPLGRKSSIWVTAQLIFNSVLGAMLQITKRLAPKSHSL